jgi:hypothetical protein
MAISGLAAAAAPTALSQALLIGRGGATILAAHGAASLVDPILTTLRGGAAKAKTVDFASPSITGLSITPEGKSVLCMATGMAFHYLGYSLARSITVALFTSSTTGYAGTPGAFPFAMAFVSPVALLLLMGYGRVLEVHGPKGALKRTTLFCASIISLASAAIAIFDKTDITLFGIPAMKYITGPLFVFRESYVQLLTAQYWSFMASVLSPNQSAKWFAPISGLTSISSAMGGMAVSKLVEKVKLHGALFCTAISLVLSLFATDMAYSIAEKNGFDPTTENLLKKKAPKRNAKKHVAEDAHTGGIFNHGGIFEKIRILFARVPVLFALFREILASQGLATLLNVCFVSSLGATITDDTARAGWVGNFYALINLISMALQFGVLPLLMQVVEPRALWRCIPLISLVFTSFQALQRAPTLYIVSASLLVMKVLEYSVRRMLDEMVYVPLDFESRFVGKEIIGVFGYRLGKSLMSLSLAVMTTAFGNFDLQQLSIFSNVVAVVWAKTAWNLSDLVPTRAEAQATYTLTHATGKGKKEQKKKRQ